MLFEPHSLYAMRLAQKGELLTHNKDRNVLTLLKMDNVLETDLKVPRRQRHTMWRIIRHSAEIVRHDWKLLMREGHNGCNCMTS